VTDRFGDDLPIREPSTLAAAIPDEATLAVSGFGSVGYPKAVPLELADAARNGRDLSLTVVSGGSVGEEIDAALVEANAIDRRYPYQARPPARDAVNDGAIAFHDRNISTLGDEVRYGRLCDPDVAIVEAAAVGEGWLVPTTSIGLTPAFVAAADELIIEVNEAVPTELETLHDIYVRDPPPDRGPLPLTDPIERIGSSRLAFDPDTLLGVVPTDRRDESYEFREPTPDDLGIAANLVGFLRDELEDTSVFDDRLALQFGVGSLGNALMGAIESVAFGDRDLYYFGEVIQDGLLDLLDDDRLEGASATSLALSADGQDRLFADIEAYNDAVVLRPGDVSNDPALIDRFGVVGVNSALETDIYGHVNSTHIDGRRVINGIGGSGDFNRNAFLSIVVFPATAAGGEISRVVPLTPHVDHTEHDVDVFITERGVAYCRGLSPRERAETIVGECAHPDYRPELEEYLERAADRGGHIPHDMDSCLDFHRSR
jgi:succinyl-CoA:acetate CoA-transferase